MKRLTVALALSAAVAASAQNTDPQLPAAPGRTGERRNPVGINVRVGYGFSPSFRTGGQSRTLQGPEFAVAIPLGTFLDQGVMLEPSFFGGGRLVGSNDADADLYRLTLHLRHVAANGVAFRAGVGYSIATRARGRDFDGESGLLVDLGVEVPFRLRVIRGVETYVDVHGIVGTDRELSGLFFGLGVRL